MAKEKLLFEKDELVEAVEELNALLFDDEHAIDIEQKEAALQQAIVDASTILEPTDKVSKDTLKIIKKLKDSGIEPTPEEEEQKPNPEEEKEEEEKPVSKGKKEEPVEDVVDLDDLFTQVDEAKERKALKAIIKENTFFAEKKEDLLDIEEFKPMQEKMLDMIEDAQDNSKKAKKAGKKEEAEEAPVKASKKEEKKEKEPSAKAGKKPDFGKRGDESFPAMAVRFLKEEASEKEIFAAFAKAYKERKDITDEKFVKGRVAIYMKLAKEVKNKK